MHKILLTAISASVVLFLLGCADPDLPNARIELIEDIIQRGDYVAASLELSNLIQQQPDNIQARLLLGKVSLAAGRPAIAEAELRHAKKLGALDDLVLMPLGRSILAQGHFSRVESALGNRPKNVNNAIGWSVIQGNAAFYNQQTELAQQHFDFIARNDPGNLDGMIGHANIQIREGNLSTAEQLLLQATQNHPLAVAAWQALGALRFSQDRHIEAERAFINAIESADGVDRAVEYMLARVGLIETQWWLDKKSLAFQNAKELANGFPWHPLPKYLRGLLAYFDAEYDIAEDNLQSVLDFVPEHLPSLKLLAAISTERGNLGRAQSFLDRYFQVVPSDLDMLRLKADTYLRMGNAAQAVNTIQPVLDRIQERSELLDFYGTANIYVGNHDLGIKYLRQAVSLAPQNIKRQTRLAAALLNQGRISEADALMRSWEAIELTEHSRQVLRLERFLRSGQLTRANEYARKLRRENPSDLHALLALAEIANMEGDEQVAIDWLEMARSRNARAVEPRILLATVYFRAYEFNAARDVAQEAAAAHPYNTTVLRILAEANLALNNYNMALATASEAFRLSPLQAQNALTLIRAQLANQDLNMVEQTIGAMTKHNADFYSALRPLLIEQFEQGDQKIAQLLLDRMKSGLPRGNSLGYETEGDLMLLRNNYADAAKAYSIALKDQKNRLLALKETVATSLSGQTDSGRALQDWLNENPRDQRAETGLPNLH